MQPGHTIIGTPGGRAFSVFAAYDRESRICLFRAYSAATSGNAARFMEYVLKSCPRSVKEIQTDGGSEFMGEFDEFNRLLERFQNDYNYNRPHRALKNSYGLLLTPAEYLKKSLICYEP